MGAFPHEAEKTKQDEGLLMKSNTQQSRPTTTDGGAVAQMIRQAIIDGELIAGQRLLEIDIGERVYASRGAVRSAFDMLVAEGTIERIKNRGVRIRSLSAQEAVEIVELRQLIESACVAKATELATSHDIEELNIIGRQMQSAVRSDDLTEYSRLNKKLHTKLLDMSRMRTAQDMVGLLRVRQARYSVRLAQQWGRPSASLPEHLAIIKAISNGDATAARRAMEVHLASVRHATEGHFLSAEIDRPSSA